MAGFFDRLLGRAEPDKPEPRPSAAATPAAACATAMAADAASADAASPPPFVCREPVLSRDRRIAGYQFSLAEDIERRLPDEMEFLPRIYDDALLRSLASLGGDTLLGPRLSLVRLSPASLDNPRLRELPAENTLLMLAPVHPRLDAAHLRPQLEALKKRGFAHGWLLRKPQLECLPDLVALAAQADCVQIEASGFDGMDLKVLLKNLAAQRPEGLPKQRLVAGRLDAVDEFQTYFLAGFDYFLGEFATRRENWHPPRSKINRMHVIGLLNLLRSNAEIPEIAQQFKHDPVLAFKLLRYINSPLMGLRTPVVSMDKALILLGQDKVYRWLSLLLFDFRAPGMEERLLTEQALARAHFLETLAGQGEMPAQADPLFILGLFSLLDQLMGQGMADLLGQAKLPKAVHDALVGQEGPYRNALLLAIAAEGRSPGELEQQAALCGLDALQVSQCAVRSLAWAHEIAALGADPG